MVSITLVLTKGISVDHGFMGSGSFPAIPRANGSSN